MKTDRKQPGVAFWATVVVFAALAYPISFGPACWITSRTNIGARMVAVVYRPITRFHHEGRAPASPPMARSS